MNVIQREREEDREKDSSEKLQYQEMGLETTFQTLSLVTIHFCVKITILKSC